jgi:type I restriction enzyme, S subunit
MVMESKPLHLPATANELPKNWRWERLDEVCEGVFDCPHSTPVLTDDGPYVARSQDVRSGVFRMEEAGHVSSETYQERVARAEPRHGDLLYSREGTYFGIAAEIPPGVRVCLGQRMVLIRPNERKANFRFLRHWLNSPVMARHVAGHRDGTVAERLNMPTIRALPVALPPLPEQQAIALVLGTLDYKIELNRRMNETLEAMAQALFQNWFVDATQSSLPKGWHESTLGEMIELAYGKPLKEEDRQSGKIPVFGSNGQVGWHNEKLVSGPGIIVGRKGNPGIVTWAPTDFFPIDTTFYVVPKGECRSLYFLFYALRQHDLASLGADSAVPGLNRNMAYASEQFVPPPGVLKRFDAIAKPLFEKIHANDEESRTLAALRDALLPKLLSGELRVPAAAKIAEANV